MLKRWTERVPPLRGDLTTLREVGRRCYTLFTLFSDPAVTAYMAPPPPTLAKFAGFVVWSHQEREQGHGLCFGIVPDGMTAAVGILQVRSLDPTLSSAEWGFVLSAHFWSTGVFFDAANVLVEFAFTTMHVDRLEARIAHAQSACTRRRAETGRAVGVDPRDVVTRGYSARSRVGVDAARRRLAEPGARSSCVSPGREATDPESGRGGEERVAPKRVA